MHNRTRMMLATSLLLVLFSCSSKDSIGDLNGGLSQGSPGAPGWPPARCDISGGGMGGGWNVTGVFDSSLTGTWEGHVQNYQFASGSALVKLVITGGDPPGYVVFGDGTPPPLPTKPGVGYPPDMPGAGGGPPFWIEEGFHYNVLSADVTGQRVKLHAASNELWQGWCPLQIPYSRGAEPCGCLPNTGYSSDINAQHCSLVDSSGRPLQDVDCRTVALCDDFGSPDPCICFADGCYAKIELDLSFDFARGTNTLQGRLDAPFGSEPVTLSKL